MTAGLIVLQPYADQIMSRQKREEYRSKPVPQQYMNRDIHLLSKGESLGLIRIYEQKKTSENEYVWFVQVVEEFNHRKRYIHPNGAQVWVKDVLFNDVKITEFTK